MSKCPHCPRSGPCGGESAPRLCELVDPTHADHRPEYLAALEPPPEPAYPPLATQAANLAGAAGRFLASGLATVSKREYRRRRAICRACPTGQYDAGADRCFRCACYLAVKPWSKAESCPDGHW